MSSRKCLILSKEDMRASLKSMVAQFMKVHLKEDVVPFAIHPPRQEPQKCDDNLFRPFEAVSSDFFTIGWK